LQSEQGVSVINLDKLTYAGNPENLKDFKNDKRYKFIHGDVCDSNLVRSLINQVDWVVHFASETHVDRSIDSADNFISTNVLGTQVLLKSVLENRRIEKFIHFSTDEVYGAIDRGSFSETSPFNPTSPYAASKAGADLLAQAYIKTHRLPIIILRGCNSFGSFQYPEKAIPLFVTNLIENKKIPLYSRGENSREWLYVEEVCRAISFVCDCGKIGEAYNVGSGFELQNIELVRMILKQMGKGEDQILYVKDRPAHDIRYKLDSSKLSLLGFKPVVNFEEQIKKTIYWYEQNVNWWKKLKNDQFTLK